MPKKGLPWCSCGWSSWYLLQTSDNSGLLKCWYCGQIVRTRSLARHALGREQARTEKLHQKLETSTIRVIQVAYASKKLREGRVAELSQIK